MKKYFLLAMMAAVSVVQGMELEKENRFGDDEDPAVVYQAELKKKLLVASHAVIDKLRKLAVEQKEVTNMLKAAFEMNGELGVFFEKIKKKIKTSPSLDSKEIEKDMFCFMMALGIDLNEQLKVNRFFVSEFFKSFEKEMMEGETKKESVVLTSVEEMRKCQDVAFSKYGAVMLQKMFDAIDFFMVNGGWSSKFEEMIKEGVRYRYEVERVYELALTNKIETYEFSLNRISEQFEENLFSELHYLLFEKEEFEESFREMMQQKKFNNEREEETQELLEKDIWKEFGVEENFFLSERRSPSKLREDRGHFLGMQFPINPELLDRTRHNPSGTVTPQLDGFEWQECDIKQEKPSFKKNETFGFSEKSFNSDFGTALERINYYKHFLNEEIKVVCREVGVFGVEPFEMYNNILLNNNELKRRAEACFDGVAHKSLSKKEVELCVREVMKYFAEILHGFFHGK